MGGRQKHVIRLLSNHFVSSFSKQRWWYFWVYPYDEDTLLDWVQKHGPVVASVYVSFDFIYYAGGKEHLLQAC